ncbi:hypothetical protein BU16DRAFT_620030 [Lophium mytilinum]|uniref:PQ-loop-domain-containing protein n=1 Tax=Lophium mytilinum TaxID=390894 RepID=A0A6A6QKW6_9PEZI|nr:hypothetical protein BU16DRAFT_620030 [Lophium mytilinum]
MRQLGATRLQTMVPFPGRIGHALSGASMWLSQSHAVGRMGLHAGSQTAATRSQFTSVTRGVGLLDDAGRSVGRQRGVGGGPSRWLESDAIYSLLTHAVVNVQVAAELVPQIWRNWRTKKTDGLPGLMVMMWASASVPFGVYAVVQNFNIPLQVQPQCFGFLSLVCWGQTLVYHSGWRVWTTTLTVGVLACTFGGLEALFICVLRGPYARGVSWPLTLMAIVASVIIALGLIPPYFELAKRKGRVIGIDFIFLTVDWSGAFFSLMALVAQHTFDYLGGILYIICLLLELGIFASHISWLYRTRHIRRLAKKAGKTYDEYMADQRETAEPTRLETGDPTFRINEHDTEPPESAHETLRRPESCMTKEPDVGADLQDYGTVDLEKGLQREQ